MISDVKSRIRTVRTETSTGAPTSHSGPSRSVRVAVRERVREWMLRPKEKEGMERPSMRVSVIGQINDYQRCSRMMIEHRTTKHTIG
jgi:hypothetical protein